MITVSNLSKRFDQAYVVSDINISIQKGEIVGLLGPNGAGKTTTLRMIAGVLPPSKGSVKINNVDITLDNSVKRNIGFLPENNPLYEEMTVEEYLSFWAHMKGIPKEQQKDAIDFVVGHCGIAEVYYRPIGELSKGYRQRVGFSQAILTKPDILILDEPTEGLDPNQRQDISALITDLSKERTVIISSHVLSELAKLASRMIIINKGTIVADATPEKLRTLGTGNQVVEVEIHGDSVSAELKKLKGVKHVEQSKKNYFELEVDKKLDIREDIFKLAVKKKWVLLTLVAKERAIEDVFSQLTHA